jgi:hypothetical protein
MFYRRLFKLKEDTQSITSLEVTHRYLRSLEGTMIVIIIFGYINKCTNYNLVCINVLYIAL